LQAKRSRRILKRMIADEKTKTYKTKILAKARMSKKGPLRPLHPLRTAKTPRSYRLDGSRGTVVIAHSGLRLTALLIQGRWRSPSSNATKAKPKRRGVDKVTPESEFTIIYDLRDAEAWMKAHRDRNAWGRTHTDYYFLDQDHVVMVFRPAPDGRWRRWEAIRRSWILEQGATSEGKDRNF
jgi:hypothetical protein